MNERHQRFVAEYLRDLNGTRAAIAAGFSPKTARVQASRLLTKADIQAAIQAAQAKHLAKLDLTAENVLEQLRRIVMFDPASIYREDGSMLPVREMPAEARAVLAGIEVDELYDGVGKDRTRIGDTTKVKFWDKNSAIKSAMAHLALLAPTEHRHEVLLRDMSDDQVRARAAQLIAKAKGT